MIPPNNTTTSAAAQGSSASLATPRVRSQRPGAPPPGWSWERIETPRLEVSSTDLRARFVDGRPLDYLLTAPVIDCIRARRLYRSAADD